MRTLPRLSTLPLLLPLMTLLPTTLLVMVMVIGSTATLSAHVGSPDVYFEGTAGPYRVLVAIRAPAVVPGVADIEVRVLDGSPRVGEVRVVPLRLTGPGAVFAPVPDLATRSDVDAKAFHAGLWMMTTGPWKVRINIDGEGGPGEVSVPVDALASRTLRMDTRLVLTLLPFGLFLVLGFVALVGASVGTAQTAPGQPTPPSRLRRARIARVLAFAIALAVLVLGNLWWGQEAKAYDEYIYKPLQLQPQLDVDADANAGASARAGAASGAAAGVGAGAAANAGRTLRLTLRDPGWLPFRVLDDLVPDHGHPMHLFAVRAPDADVLLHLHPEQLPQDPASFVTHLRGVASGTYRLFADIVHATGLPETAAADLSLPEIASAPQPGDNRDDSEATAPAHGAFQPDRVVADLPGGAHMTWERDRGSLKAKQPYLLTFRIADADGTPARDMTLYMGMPGHAIVLRRDFAVFAHVHPSGTAPMASLALTASAANANPNPNPHAQHMAAAAASTGAGAAATVQPMVTFPYGFPSPGEYRLFVQVKRSAGVQTGVFDVRVE